MVSALGVNQAWLFTGVFFLVSFLAGLGGAVQIPREPAQLFLDITVIAEAFVVVVVGGLGSIPGAFLAAFIISVGKAFCIGIGDQTILGIDISFSRLTLVVEFIIMAVVLVVRPWGLLGKPQAIARVPGLVEHPLPAIGNRSLLAGAAIVVVLATMPALGDRYLLVLLIDVFVFALFAVSLHFLMGPAGMVSFGHAAYFGLGAYGAGLLLKQAGIPMELTLLLAPLVAGIGALAFGWFTVRLSGVYLAMLTLAFAQITWSVAFQWDGFTGGSNGMVGVWPSSWLSDRTVFYYLTLAVCVCAVATVWRIVYSPFGYALRAGRDSPLRAESIGIDLRRLQWFAFALSGLFAGIAGTLFAYSKGSISPETLAIPRSVDGLVMVLLGGVQTLVGPVVGAAVFTWLHDELARATEYWRAVMGLVILVLVVVFPHGIAGYLGHFLRRIRGAA